MGCQRGQSGYSHGFEPQDVIYVAEGVGVEEVGGALDERREALRVPVDARRRRLGWRLQRRGANSSG